MQTTVINRKRRADIAQETLAILERGNYISQHGNQVSIQGSLTAAKQASIHYSPEELKQVLRALKSGEKFATAISVTNEGCLTAASRLASENRVSPLCLNFASAKNPGGGFLSGSEAQEENLAKSSGLYPCIAQMTAMYEKNRALQSCIYSDDMIYSPNVPVFRDEDYALLDNFYNASFITAPAVNLGALKMNEPERVGEAAGIMLNRINLVLALALKHGHRHLVLGAWGCGVFGNDPQKIAACFLNALSPGSIFHGAFEKIVFAVLDKKNTGSLQAFETTFTNNK
ncbi:TIGR02452 family protein [Undibacterium sp. KW1]|uniref:TIGR02452 family protein n=1 Tax=Undibacterium sp. KW1 TaxID=2058624 RepID=UPI001331DADB|nr:TIGR02452 family protein [Undibacterium sp. KW1]BBB58520.1 TIGR02452 family protein [Undibacterium sp. KW1]